MARSGFHIVALAGLIGGLALADEVVPEGAAPPEAWEPAALPADRLTLALDIPPGTSFGELASDWGLPAHALRDAALEVHDLAKIRTDSELGVVLVDGEDAPDGLRYQLDADRTLVLTRAGDGWDVDVEEVQYTSRVDTVSLELTSSLWEAGMAAGLVPSDLARLAELFAFELDFNTELRAGATLDLVAEVLSAEGRRDKLGLIHAVRMVNAGRLIEMVRFVEEGEPEHYYHPDGSSTVGAFLRSPLEFSRVTSGFNPRRYHPILKTRRPHNGTDFGAPSGTPVRAVGAGTVTYAGRNGGHGNFVKIQHDGSYETSYSHLSKIHVRRGQRVGMGDLIGRVGSTGMSTGPHLHFQMWKDGRYIDPMSANLPVERPLPERHMTEFQELAARWLGELGPAPVEPSDEG